MGIRETARTELAQRLADRTRALGDRFQQRETPVASSAGDLVLQELPTTPEGSVDEIMALYPVPDGDFVLTDRTLYYRDKRGNVYLLPLASITAWRQRRTEYYDHLPSRLRRRILRSTSVRPTGSGTSLRRARSSLGRFARRARSAVAGGDAGEPAQHQRPTRRLYRSATVQLQPDALGHDLTDTEVVRGLL